MKIPPGAVSNQDWTVLEARAVVHIRTDQARFEVTGSGALACLQGLVTCDLAKAPDRSRSYGGLLTSKGMIVAPLWIERQAPDRLVIETPARASAAVEGVFARSLPPRLCRWSTITDATAGLGLYGPLAASLKGFTGALPATVRGASGLDGTVPAGSAGAIVSALLEQGAVRASQALMESCRIFAGIPALGAEIDEKTLPQEVRFDELGAVSYTKGCYLGQETVARVHFRGHPNRRLVLLVFDEEPPDPPAEIRDDDKPTGRLTSAAWSPELDAWVGQAVIRREVADGATVHIGETTAVVRDRWLRAP